MAGQQLAGLGRKVHRLVWPGTEALNVGEAKIASLDELPPRDAFDRTRRARSLGFPPWSLV
jgi:hypothetical protein